MKHENLALDTTTDSEAGQARLEEVVAGLRERPMRLSPIWFYDERGSQLFERICELQEYYPTRTELGIMAAHAHEMAEALGPHVALVEPGSGASLKTRRLLDALDRPACYVPVDISREHLLNAAKRLKRDYPGLEVLPVCGDFSRSLDVPDSRRKRARRRVVYFPGSTIGNFANDQAVQLLERMRFAAGPEGAVLLGIDRVKPAPILERAYDDASGVTAAFNLNALRHLNRELGTQFDLAAFRHRAPWVAEHSRIEMHLVATRDQHFRVAGEAFHIARDNYLLTEYSHKYTVEAAARLAAAAGLDVRRVWSDPQDWFSVLLLEPL